MNLSEAIDIARGSLWLSQQPAKFQDTLCSRLRLISVARNDSIFHNEDEAHEIYCLVEGTAVISVAHPVAGMVTAQAMQPGRWFGEPAALGRRPRIMSVHARTHCYLLAISRGSIDDMLQAQPAVCWNFFNLIAYNIEEHLLHAVDLLIQDQRLRLCSRLLTLAGRRLDHLPPSPVNIPISKEELAIASCMSRQTVHMLLGDLVQQGICELGYREIRVLDMAALARQLNGSFPNDAMISS